ncbi:MAG: tetratricopeptide repeat protein [Candidatus Acidiferrum sp.]
MEQRTARIAALPKLEPDRIEKMSVVLLFVLAAACYVNTLFNAFVYDDELQILQNPYIKSWEYLPAIFRTTVWSFIGSAGETNYYRPLMTLTYLALWKAFGNLPLGFHLFNLLVNALVVTCVYYAGRELFKDQWAAVVAAALFAVHPVHTETVSWIAAVPDLEATLLCLLAFFVYAKSPEIGWKRQALVVLCFLLALLAKEPALMLVALLVYYEHFVREGRNETTFVVKVKRYLPACAAGAGYLLLRIALLGKLAPVLQHAQVTWPQAIYSAFALVSEYARLLLWPARLSAFHVFHVSNSFEETSVLLGAGIVVASAVLALLFHRRWPAAAFCIVWIGVTLAPVLNARWMAANVLTERYLYLPSVGFCWLAGWVAKGTWNFLNEKKNAQTALRVALCAAGIALAVLGTAKTWARNRIWSDDVTLYTKTLETDPDSYVMHMNLGVNYYEKRDFARSEQELRRALALKPDSPNVLNALGCVYLEEDRPEEAARLLQRAIALKPQWTDPHFNYGRILKKIGQNDAALAEFRKAVKVGPLNATARLFLADELAERGKDSEAEEEYRESIKLSPSLMAQRNLVNILLRTGNEISAEMVLRQIATAYPYDSATHIKLGRLLEKNGKTEEAKREYTAALVTDPANAEALAALRRFDSATKKQKPD